MTETTGRRLGIPSLCNLYDRAKGDEILASAPPPRAAAVDGKPHLAYEMKFDRENKVPTEYINLLIKSRDERIEYLGREQPLLDLEPVEQLKFAIPNRFHEQGDTLKVWYELCSVEIWYVQAIKDRKEAYTHLMRKECQAAMDTLLEGAENPSQLNVPVTVSCREKLVEYRELKEQKEEEERKMLTRQVFTGEVCKLPRFLEYNAVSNGRKSQNIFHDMVAFSEEVPYKGTMDRKGLDFRTPPADASNGYGDVKHRGYKMPYSRTNAARAYYDKPALVQAKTDLDTQPSRELLEQYEPTIEHVVPSVYLNQRSPRTHQNPGVCDIGHNDPNGWMVEHSYLNEARSNILLNLWNTSDHSRNLFLPHHLSVPELARKWIYMRATYRAMNCRTQDDEKLGLGVKDRPGEEERTLWDNRLLIIENAKIVDQSQHVSEQLMNEMMGKVYGWSNPLIGTAKNPNPPGAFLLYDANFHILVFGPEPRPRRGRRR